MFVTYRENSLIVKWPSLIAKIRKQRKKSFLGSATSLKKDKLWVNMWTKFTKIEFVYSGVYHEQKLSRTPVAQHMAHLQNVARRTF